MAIKKNKKSVKVRDLKPKKDAKGGGGRLLGSGHLGSGHLGSGRLGSGHN